MMLLSVSTYLSFGVLLWLHPTPGSPAGCGGFIACSYLDRITSLNEKELVAVSPGGDWADGGSAPRDWLSATSRAATNMMPERRPHCCSSSPGGDGE